MAKRLISIYYGTETGNSKWIAESLATAAAKRGAVASVHDLVNVSAQQFSEDPDPCIFVISTWNRGQPPFFARRFCAEIAEGRVLMPNVRYTVIALGNETYGNFCACGKILDGQLEKLGAKRFMPRRDMGGAFKSDFEKWLPDFWEALRGVE
jgi:sulfite reductase (NADPH) flavoprotein alpha-component